jgi:hypothetical protein
MSTETPSLTPINPHTPGEPTPEVTAAQVAMGIEYTERFTLKQALDSWNTTRKDQPQGDGTVITAESQRVTIAPDWFIKHAGTFQLRKPSFYDDLAISVRFEELTNGRKLPWRLSWLCDATAIAENLLVDGPEWFELGKITDNNILLLVHHWYRSWEARFRQSL